jgi:hypothetical protein
VPSVGYFLLNLPNVWGILRPPSSGCIPCEPYEPQVLPEYLSFGKVSHPQEITTHILVFCVLIFIWNIIMRSENTYLCSFLEPYCSLNPYSVYRKFESLYIGSVHFVFIILFLEVEKMCCLCGLMLGSRRPLKTKALLYSQFCVRQRGI